ncbi:hypothetical protein GCM10009712_05490 [Pseudarthrobacter sulfonivorans]|uniref:hypothetical protein n=1 Tax=Pseudarthrobacter sulfonivorans TaxID=121292 RepID=UPI00168AC41A|nr:hypothetical protein [Pseudarthrobacter sulfonivorans]
MTVQTGRIFGRVTSYVGGGALIVAGVIAGLVPYSEGGYSGLCPSALQSLTGGTTTGQSFVNLLSGGRCTTYANTMTIIMAVLMILGIAALITGILLRKRQDIAAGGGYQAYGNPAEQGNTAAPAQPAYAPMTGQPADTSPYAGSGRPAAVSGDPTRRAAGAGQGSGSFDTKLLMVGVAAVAGVVLVSFLVDLLAFLPGIVELLLWTAVGLTAIWQLKRRAAGTDEGKLAAAEAWNPAVVARSLVAAVRSRLEDHRAQRRQAERAPANTAAPTFAAESEFRGDDGMVRPDGH